MKIFESEKDMQNRMRGSYYVVIFIFGCEVNCAWRSIKHFYFALSIFVLIFSQIFLASYIEIFLPNIIYMSNLHKIPYFTAQQHCHVEHE